MEDCYVDVQQSQTPENTIEKENGDRCPDVAVHLDRGMEMDECEEYRERDNVLYDKKLVAPTSNGCHGTEDNPYQDTPCGEAFPGDLVVF